MSLSSAAKLLGAVVLLVPLVCPVPARTLGTILGTATDNTGAVIPGVSVEITNKDQGTASMVETQGDGTYYLPNVRPGSYSIPMEADGFRPLLVNNVRLEVGSVLTYDAAPEVGALTETVTPSRLPARSWRPLAARSRRLWRTSVCLSCPWSTARFLI